MSEYMEFDVEMSDDPLVAVIATTGIILAALYILWLYQRTMTGPVKPGCEDIKDLGGREIVAVSPLVALILALGVFPAPALDVINPANGEVFGRVAVAGEAAIDLPVSAAREAFESGVWSEINLMIVAH